ncbi:ankyrin repeat-containing domain protein [Dactylonectria estremocensis]|uniref:Ankyrin repeat-containing domain protein n=1 Tax=Dactylonectria estremocensis TaxID=1079267 RepID=A0A9P9D2Y2_9HYPO|nr:ankyrin repeat-containing domain protein [Dactylonectria estremocensis]
MYPPSEAIFAAVRYLISVSKGVSADYDKVAGFFEDLRSYLSQLKILENNVPQIPELKVVLAEVFTSILVLCAICTKYIHKKRVVKAFRALISGEDAELKDAYENFHKMVDRERGTVMNAILLRVEQTNNDTLTVVAGMKENITLADRIDHNLRSVMDGPRRMYRYVETGSGKTVMMSTAVSYIEENTEGSNVAIAYAYCDYQDRNTLSETSIWSSIIRQLVESCLQIPTEVTASRDKYLEKRSLPTDEERILLVKALSRLFQKTYILIDALNLTRINVFAHSTDVEGYLNSKMRTSKRMSSWIAKDPTLRDDVIHKLLEKTDGMFLLAHLQMEDLCKRSSLKNVRSSLDSLVGDMEAFYKKALQRIEDQQDDDRHLARKALSFVFYAKRPLKLDELFHALSIEPGDIDFDKTAFTETHILLSATAGLLLVDEQTNDARLVHLTLHEYLEKHQSHLLEPESDFATTCLTYLSFETFGRGPCTSEKDLDQRIRQYAFLPYASHHWGHRFATNQEQDVDEIVRFLGDEAKLASSIQMLYIPRHRRDGWHDCFPRGFTSLHAAAHWGLEGMFAAVCRADTDANCQDSQRMTALHLCSRRGFAELTRLLLAKGADTDVTNDWGETALTWAARNGHRKVMELLIAGGANPLIEDDEGWIALHWAVIGRHDDLVKLLLGQYAGLSSDNLQTHKALILAAEAGRNKTTEMLLQDALDIDRKDEEGSTALHWAVAEGHEQTSSLLLKNGADTNSKDNYDNTPLHWAIPYTGITLLLLENGANPDSGNNTKQTPLHWSAQAGLEGVTKELLEHGGNADIQDKYGITALHAAALQGHEAIVDLLLLNGANANIMDEDGWTPLHAAIVKQHDALQRQLVCKTENGDVFLDQMRLRMKDENECALLEEMAEKKSHGSTVVSGLRSAVNSGYRERVLALLDSGADIDAEDQIGDSTALTHAAWLGREGLVELLLENGADPNRRERHGRAALHIAAGDGYSDIVRILVENGADVDTKVHGWTPMLLAAKAWRFQIPDYLITRGANVNAADYHGRRALHWAAHHGGVTLARLLLQRGAEIEAQDRWGKTAFQWAVADGQHRVADLLRQSGADTSRVR